MNIVIVYNASVSKFGMDTCCTLLSLGVCKKKWILIDKSDKYLNCKSIKGKIKSL